MTFLVVLGPVDFTTHTPLGASLSILVAGGLIVSALGLWLTSR